MNAQYRFKEDWKPVGSSKMAKRLADWMNSVAKQLNRAEVVSGGTACPTDLGFRIEVDSGSGDYPFRIAVTNTEIRITQGTWTRLGIPLALAPDAGETYKSLTTLADSSPFGADATYVVYLALENATSDPALVPSAINVYAAATLPADTSEAGGNIYCQLGTVDTNSDSQLILAHQDRTGGDKDDVALVPDSDSFYDAAGAKRNYSVQFHPDAGRHQGNLQDYGWHNAESYTDYNYDQDMLLLREVVDEGGADEHYRKRYVLPEEMKVGEAEYAEEAGHATTADDVSNFDHDLEYHNDYSLDGEKSEGRIATCLSGANWTWKDGSYFDDRWWANLTAGGVDDQDYSTSGAVTAGSFNIDASNVWDETQLLVDVSTSFFFKKSGIDVADWVNRTFYDQAGVTAIEFGSAFSRHLRNSSNGISLDYENNQLQGAWAVVDGNFNLDDPAYVYTHGGNAGLTISGFSSGGLLTGPDVSEYSIRVIPAGGGDPIELRVLGRPI